MPGDDRRKIEKATTLGDRFPGDTGLGIGRYDQSLLFVGLAVDCDGG